MKAAEVKSAASKLHETIAEIDAGIRSIRDRIRELSKTRHEVEDAPVAHASAVSRLDAWLGRLKRDAIEEYPFYTLTAPRSVSPNDFPSPASYSFGALVFAGAANGMREILVAELDRRYRAHAGFEDGERARRLQTIDDELLALNLSEESLIRTAEVAGFALRRRGDADPRAVLAADECLPK